MTATRLPSETRKARLLAVIGARSGSTAEELAQILDWNRRTTDHWLTVMVRDGSVDRHGSLGRVRRYTLPGGVCSRPLAPRGPADRLQIYRDRASTVRAILRETPMTRGGLMRRTGLTARPIETVLLRMQREGVVKPVGRRNSLGRRWVLV